MTTLESQAQAARNQELAQMRKRISSGIRNQQIFAAVGVLFTTFAVLVLLAALLDLIIDGAPRLTYDFFTNFPSRRAEQAGILSAWVGSALVMLVVMVAAVPVGIGAAVYLEEYAKKNWFTDLIEINVTNQLFANAVDPHLNDHRARLDPIALDHLGLAHGGAGFVPHLVREVGVGGDDVDLGDGLLELGVVVGRVFNFGRAVEGEGRRHEDQDRPLAHQALLADFNELAVVESLGLERQDLGVDQGHGGFLVGLGLLDRCR
jgi:hypothetical protein